MQKQKMSLEISISGLKVTGNVYSLGQLSAKFQIWCRQFGIDDGSSLALLVAKTDEATSYFDSEDVAIKKAESVLSKLPELKEVDVTEFGNSPIHFAIIR